MQTIKFIPFNFADYISTDMDMMIEQILEPDHILRDIHGSHKDPTEKSMKNNGSDVSGELKSVILLKEEVNDVKRME